MLIYLILLSQSWSDMHLFRIMAPSPLLAHQPDRNVHVELGVSLWIGQMLCSPSTLPQGLSPQPSVSSISTWHYGTSDTVCTMSSGLVLRPIVKTTHRSDFAALKTDSSGLGAQSHLPTQPYIIWPHHCPKACPSMRVQPFFHYIFAV